MLNAVRFGAKRKVKWCKMQGVLLLNAGQNAAKCKQKTTWQRPITSVFA